MSGIFHLGICCITCPIICIAVPVSPSLFRCFYSGHYGKLLLACGMCCFCRLRPVLKLLLINLSGVALAC